MIFHESRPSPPFHPPTTASDLGGRRRRWGLVNDSTTTCGVCARPRDTKYRRVIIPSDAAGPQEQPGADERVANAPGAGSQGGGLYMLDYSF